jgi:hypothetical protein
LFLVRHCRAYLLIGPGLASIFFYFGIVALIGAAVAAGWTMETTNRLLVGARHASPLPGGVTALSNLERELAAEMP